MPNKKTEIKKEETIKIETAVKKPVSKKKTELSPSEMEAAKKAYDLAYTIAEYLDEKKGSNITLINLLGKTIIADYFVIATASSTTAVRSLTEYIDEKLSKDHNLEPLRRDIDSKWSAIDYGSVIMHIQTEESRSFYDLERLWSDGTNTEYFKGK